MKPFILPVILVIAIGIYRDASAATPAELVVASLRAGDFVRWETSYGVSVFSPAVQVTDVAALPKAANDALAARESRIAEAYDYIQRYKELPRISVPKRDSLVRQAQQALNQSARCPGPHGYRACKAFESDGIFRAQWSAALSRLPGDGAEAELRKLQRDWDILGHRREVAVAQSNLHNLITLDPAFLFFSLQQEFAANAGAWVDGSVGPATSVEISELGDAAHWRKVQSGGVTVFYTLARLRRPWFDFGAVSRFFWRLNRASPAGPDLKFSNGKDCTLALGCIPQWVILARSDLSAEKLQLLGTVDVQSPLLPGDSNEWQSVGKENVSRSLTFGALLDALDSSSF